MRSVDAVLHTAQRQFLILSTSEAAAAAAESCNSIRPLVDDRPGQIISDARPEPAACKALADSQPAVVYKERSPKSMRIAKSLDSLFRLNLYRRTARRKAPE